MARFVFKYNHNVYKYSLVCLASYFNCCISLIQFHIAFQVFDFDLSGKALGPEDFLKVIVKDHETFGRNRIVGKADVYMQELLKTNTATLSAVLNDKNDRPTTVSDVLNQSKFSLRYFCTNSYPFLKVCFPSFLETPNL